MLPIKGVAAINRRAFDSLVAWSKSRKRKPLLIRGARQVGKTWLMKEFGRSFYEKTAYINFDNNERMKNLFQGDFEEQRIITALQIETKTKIVAENTLLIFDEIQEAPQAISALKYFFEEAPHYQILAAGSLLGVAMHQEASFPVGKVDFLDLYPLDFIEFIEASGHDELTGLIREQDYALLNTFSDKYIDLLRQYFYLGGMPEVVADYLSEHDFRSAREIQKRILKGYEYDFSKHISQDYVPRVRMLWNSIPTQLAKENRKFLYRLIKSGARAREYELALNWLSDCGLIHQVPRVSKPGMPLIAYQDQSAFKIYHFDVGLLSAMSNLPVEVLLEGNRVFEEFKGAIAEQYVLQQLKAAGNIDLYYWAADKGTAEVDFVCQLNSVIIPLEVKATINLQAKSLKSYRERFNPVISVRTSLSDFKYDREVIDLPLFAIIKLLDIVHDFLS